MCRAHRSNCATPCFHATFDFGRSSKSANMESLGFGQNNLDVNT